MVYKTTVHKVLTQLRGYNIKVYDLDKYFSCYLVKNNYGISGVDIDNDVIDITFHIQDEKKFALKVVKYGF